METILHLLPLPADGQDAFRAAAPGSASHLPSNRRSGRSPGPCSGIVPADHDPVWLRTSGPGFAAFRTLNGSRAGMRGWTPTWPPACCRRAPCLPPPLGPTVPLYPSICWPCCWPSISVFPPTRTSRAPISGPTGARIHASRQDGLDRRRRRHRPPFCPSGPGRWARPGFWACAGSARDVQGFDQVYALDALDMLLPKADVVALALPHAPETVRLLDRRRLMRMKPRAVLLNAGRGSAVDCAALAELLSARASAGGRTGRHRSGASAAGSSALGRAQCPHHAPHCRGLQPHGS